MFGEFWSYLAILPDGIPNQLAFIIPCVENSMSSSQWDFKRIKLSGNKATWWQNYLNTMEVTCLAAYSSEIVEGGFSFLHISSLHSCLYCLHGDLKEDVKAHAEKWWYCDRGILAFIKVWGWVPRNFWKREWCDSCDVPRGGQCLGEVFQKSAGRRCCGESSFLVGAW